MDETRAVEPIEEMAARHDRELTDLKLLIDARLNRRPTGDVEMTVRPTPKADQLFMQGQTLNRADYPVLWQWVQDQALVPSMFGAGNGTTTFVLPDLRGRVPIGAGTLGSDAYALGAAGGASARALVTANMPSHDHDVGVSLSQHEGHSHAIDANGGNHGGHFPAAQQVLVPAGSTYGVAPWNAAATGNNAHSHGMSIEGQGKPHSVTVSEQLRGSGTPLDVRQAYLAVNWAIWV